METITPTPTQALASLKLGRDVIEWASEQRSLKPRPSFRSISTTLRDLTDVDVTDETIRNWCAEGELRRTSAVDHGACPVCTTRRRQVWHAADQPCPFPEAS